MDALRKKAIALVARREHTHAELARKLSPHGSAEDVEAVIGALQLAGLQSDVRFAEAYLRAKGARLGPARLRQGLRQKGVDAETVTTQLQDADLPEELDQARQVWTRKFGNPPVDAREWARQARFLQSRGFSSAVIRRLLRQGADEDMAE